MKILIVALTTFLSLHFSVYGQEAGRGFCIEILRSQNSISSNGSLDGELSSKGTLGFGFGGIFLFQNKRNFSLRLGYGLNIQGESVRLENATGRDESGEGRFYLKVPTHALIKLGKSPFSFVAGINPSINLISLPDNRDLDFKTFNIAGDIGFNYDFKIGKKSLVPELKYSHSFINGINNSASRYGIDKYFRNGFMLTIFVIW